MLRRLFVVALVLVLVSLAASAQQFPPNPVTPEYWNGSAWVPTTVTAPFPTTAAPSPAPAVGITPISSASLESNHVLKASAGNLYSYDVTATSTPGYVMVFNATSAPADGAVLPEACYPIPTNQWLSYDVNGGPPDVFSTGITLVFSTTGCFTKTASATAFFRGKVK